MNQFTYLYTFFTDAIYSGEEVRVVFCDISKAFDRVWHTGLLYKLKLLGITGSLLNWCSSYMSNRRQRTVIPGAQSSLNFVRAGVPQGSSMGPLLLDFINDIVVLYQFLHPCFS